MKKYAFICLVILAVVLLVSCSNQPSGTTAITSVPPKSEAPSSAQTQAPSSAQTQAPASGQTAAISIEGFAFSPASLTISAGTTVVWTNNDSVGHNIKSDAFNSPMLSQGQTFQFKFDTKGTYEYTCGVHPSMKGQIIVN